MKVQAALVVWFSYSCIKKLYKFCYYNHTKDIPVYRTNKWGCTKGIPRINTLVYMCDVPSFKRIILVFIPYIHLFLLSCNFVQPLLVSFCNCLYVYYHIYLLPDYQVSWAALGNTSLLRSTVKLIGALWTASMAE